MLLKAIKKLLARKLITRVALKLLAFKNKLRVYRKVLRKLPIHFNLIPKLTLVVFVLLFFAPLQPSFSIPPVSENKVIAQFTQEQNIEAKDFSEPFSLPHPGYLTTQFSSWHPGVDIATGLGMPVHPILKGKVTEVNFNFWGYGNQVKVEHEQGLTSTYSHMSRVYAKIGDLVNKNSILGEVGLTGRTTGPHTHLEMKKNEVYIDPLKLLPNIPSFNDYAKNFAQSN